MRHTLPITSIAFIYLNAASGLFSQTPDAGSGSASQEIAQLRRTVTEQERRIASLERTMRSLQTTILAANRRPVILSWRTIEGWSAVKIGISRAQVEGILGEPNLVDSVMDRQTLYYKEPAATVALGKVIITDDRVSEVDAPGFQIHLPVSK